MKNPLYVNSLISKDTARFLNLQMFRQLNEQLDGTIKIDSVEGSIRIDEGQVIGNITAYCAYQFDVLQHLLLERMEELTNKRLYPTYTYYRLYQNSQELKLHTDRPECEYSVTINLGKSHDWPIYMETNLDEFVAHEIETGDGVVYEGCTTQHYRKPFQGHWYSQVFLHYIDASNPDAKQRLYDDREFVDVEEVLNKFNNMNPTVL